MHIAYFIQVAWSSGHGCSLEFCARNSLTEADILTAWNVMLLHLDSVVVYVDPKQVGNFKLLCCKTSETLLLSTAIS